MAKILTYAQIALLGSMLMACDRTPLTAEQVAHEFWQSVSAGHTGKVKKWVVPVAGLQVQKDDFPEIDEYQFEKMVIEPSQAVFNTNLVTAAEAKPVYVRTYLIKNEEDWQVDYRQTLASYQRQDQVGEIFSQLSEFGDLLNNEINQSLDKLNETLPQLEQEIDQIEKKVETELPQLQEKFKSFLEKLQEFLQRWQQTLV